MDVWEPLVDGPVYDDVGVDGCSDEFEDGFGGCLDVATNAVGSDLNQDNWHPVNNPDGTEANGLPNTGEPDVDQNDLEEKMRETQSFTVVDVSDPLNETTVMDNQTALNGEDFNAISNGFQVFVYNDTLKIDEQALTWTNGNSIWEADIEVYESSSIHGVASPNDFRLEFYDHVVDTAVVATLDGLFKTGKPLVVKVYDTIAEEYMDMLQIGVRDSTLEVGSQILPILYQREDKVGDWIPTWRFQFHSPMEVVQEIFELEDGVIAGTAYKGMHIYSEENDTWQSYTMSSTGGGLISNNVSDVKYYDGMFWIATGYGPVFFDGSSWYHNVRLETIFDEWAPDDEKELEDEEKSKKYEGCSAIARDPDGLVWLGSKRNGLVRVNTNGTYDTSMDDSLEFYVTPDSIIEVFDFDDGDLNDLFVDDDRTVWAATNSGIAAYNYQDSTWKTYIKDNVNGLENKKITCIIQLPEEFGNTLVFGTEKGIAFKVGEMFTVYTNTDDYLPHNKVYSLYYRNANELYIGTQDGYAVFDISQANSDFTAGITSELFEASWGNETIYQDSRIRAIEFVGDIGYFGTEQGVEQRLSANEWNTFGPQPGDVFDMSTDKPFSSFDTYQFTTYGGQESASKVADDLSEVAVVPNPYVGAAVWEKKPYLQSGRGERKIYFINLPRDCTIRIYTLAGELVKILEHHDTVYNGQEPWDLLNADNLEIAYGIYVYHIEAENAETVGKFAVIK